MVTKEKAYCLVYNNGLVLTGTYFYQEMGESSMSNGLGQNTTCQMQ